MLCVQGGSTDDVMCKEVSTIDTEHGESTVHTYSDSISNTTHLAFTKGEISPGTCDAVRVRWVVGEADAMGSILLDRIKSTVFQKELPKLIRKWLMS